MYLCTLVVSHFTCPIVMTNMFYPFLTVLCTTALNSEITYMAKGEELLYMEFENKNCENW